MAKTLTKPFVAGDWLIREDDSPAYSRGSQIVDNTSGAVDMVLPGGYPMVGAVPTIAATIITGTTITGAVFEPTTIPKGEKAKVCVIERGFNVVNADALPLVEPPGVGAAASGGAGATWTKAQIVATYGTLSALKWLMRNEPSLQMEQAN